MKKGKNSVKKASLFVFAPQIPNENRTKIDSCLSLNVNLYIVSSGYWLQANGSKLKAPG